MVSFYYSLEEQTCEQALCYTKCPTQIRTPQSVTRGRFPMWPLPVCFTLIVLLFSMEPFSCSMGAVVLKHFDISYEHIHFTWFPSPSEITNVPSFSLLKEYLWSSAILMGNTYLMFQSIPLIFPLCSQNASYIPPFWQIVLHSFICFIKTSSFHMNYWLIFKLSSCPLGQTQKVPLLLSLSCLSPAFPYTSSGLLHLL
jgi:hypothetical protein